jgi:type II secretory pathway component PulF
MIYAEFEERFAKRLRLREQHSKLVNRLEQWTLYPMIFLWVVAFIVGFYDAYRYLENNL